MPKEKKQVRKRKSTSVSRESSSSSSQSRPRSQSQQAQQSQQVQQSQSQEEVSSSQEVRGGEEVKEETALQTLQNVVDTYVREMEELKEEIVRLEKRYSTLLKNLKNGLVRERKEGDKELRKGRKKRRNGGGNKGGLQNKKRATDLFCDVVDLERGSELSRPEATKLLSAYVKRHELDTRHNQKKKNGETSRSFFVPDDRLRKVLKLPNDVKLLKITDCQKYMKNVFAV